MAQLARDAEGNLFQWSAAAGEYVPSSDTGTLGAIGQGAVGAVQDVTAGLNELGGSLEAFELGRSSPGSPQSQQAQGRVDQIRQDQVQRDQANQGISNRNPIAFGLGSAAPFVAAGAATAGLGLLPTAAIEGGLGAIQGAGRSAADRMMGAGIGAALGGTGYVLGAGLGRMGARVGQQVRGAGANTQARARFYGNGLGDGPPGSIVDEILPGQGQINQAGQQGLGMRTMGRIFKRDAQPNIRSIRVADELKFKLTPADRLGSKSAKNQEAWLNSTAGGQVPFQELANHNQDLMNQLAAKSIGLDNFAKGGKLDPDTIGQAQGAIDRGFSDIADSVGRVDLTQSKAVGSRAAQGLDLTDEAAKALQIIEKTPDAANGRSAYGRYTRIRRQEAQARLRNEGDLAEALDTTAEAILDDIAASGPPGIRKEIDKLQEQFMLLKSIQSAVSQEGDVPIVQLANRLAKGKYTRNKWTRTDGERGMRTKAGRNLFKATKAMQAFKDRVGNSGTATRLGGGLDFAQGLLQRPFADAYLGNIPGAAARGGAGVAVGGVLGERILD